MTTLFTIQDNFRKTFGVFDMQNYMGFTFYLVRSGTKYQWWHEKGLLVFGDITKGEIEKSKEFLTSIIAWKTRNTKEYLNLNKQITEAEARYNITII